MTPAQGNKFESCAPKDSPEESLFSALSSCALCDVQRLKQVSDLSPGTIPRARISENGELMFCSEPVKTPMESKEQKDNVEQKTDRKIKDSFGAEVFDHLKDWDWLIQNRKKLEDGFKKASNQDAWDMAWRMRELSLVDGKPLIFLSKVDGQTAGNLIPKRHDIYLRRGRFRSDDCIGQVSH